ncbi:hypothetical protein IW261DRAFT_1562489 [Armillaria novae-zelandiae]|uniref:Uncharacterized protein n=1 Tax=Armillaria novae-zelandiae TaxID=153914 RepID=A0AA39PFS8_9AGAR|nr:hypothetical protein IW261DRAFT_1562489 [Armillaria novae-zelandiae]
MAFKSGNAQGTKVHDLMAQVLGSAIEAPGSGTTILQAPAPVSNEPVDIERGKYLVWELCELNFQQELLLLDMHLTHPDSSAKEEDVINFRLKCQEQIMGLFFDGSHSSSLCDNYPGRVLLEAETRYANVLAWNGVQKLSIFSGWHSSHQNRGKHYTLQGYNREGWMVVMLEMKAGNAGEVFAYGRHAHRQWLHNACRNGHLLAPKHVFRAREHEETPSIENLFYKLMYDTVSKLGKIGIEYLVYQSLSTYQISGLDMDGIAIIEIPVKDSFIG